MRRQEEFPVSKGYLTVYLSLSLALILSFILTFVEGARMSVIRRQSASLKNYLEREKQNCTVRQAEAKWEATTQITSMEM